MTNIKSLPIRKEVPINETWDLSAIFKDEKALKESQAELTEKTKVFKELYQGKLKQSKDSDFILQAIQDYEKLYFIAIHINAYASLDFSTDMRNAKLGKLNQEVNLLLADFFANTSFVDSELALIDDQIIEEAIKKTSHYKHYLKNKLEDKKYLLSAETEEVLAALSPTLNLPENLYETIKAQDMFFSDFEVNGNTYPLSYVAYENNYAFDKNPEIRRKSFSAFSETLEKYHHVNAELMLGEFTKKHILSKLRGFKNATEADLYTQKSNRELYDRQIDILMNELAPHMQRYAKLIQKVHGLEEMHYADLLTPIDPDYEPDASIESAKKYISDAMQFMGQDYHDMVMASFPERWIDFAQNQGKSTGGFCASVPGVHPYILLNWSGKLSEVFTLAHELGHACQSILVEKNNRPLEQEMPFYLIESPSTAHELLLVRSLLEQNSDPRFKRFVLSSMIGKTYFHNAVTHLLEGAFQRDVYDRIANNEQLSADDLDSIFYHNLKKFWGDAVILDKGCEKTWMRQSHYYRNLYSYTYSASLVVSTDFYLSLEKDSEKQIKNWMKYLKTGGPLSVIEQAKIIGVDLTTEKPLRNMIAFIGKSIDEMEELSRIIL